MCHPAPFLANTNLKKKKNLFELPASLSLVLTSKDREEGMAFIQGNVNPLQYSRLENPTDGGAWWATVHGVTESPTRLSDFTFTFKY